MNAHLVILRKPYLDAILEGRKTIESRFTRTRRAFFDHVQPGDVLFLKQSSGPVRATARVASAEQFQNLTPAKISELKGRYNHLILGTEEYWRSKSDCPYGLLVWLTDVSPADPVRICKRDWRGWVVLTEKDNFGLLG